MRAAHAEHRLQLGLPQPDLRRLVRLLRVVGREYGLVALGLGILAVHVLDDSFLQPQPGTSAGDHLVGGLVPIGVLALVVAVYPHLRAGLRAPLALTFGVLGLVGAIGGSAYYAVELGPSGDAYTGLLAIPAALTLVAVGAVTLWRTRRLDESLPRRYLRRALLSLAAVPIAVWIVYPIGVSYVVTHAARAVVPPARLGEGHEHVTFRTSDGLRLSGWYVPSKNGAAVIVSPGRSAAVQKHAVLLSRHGYGVLVFDRRGEGESEGDPNLYGWAGDTDLQAALHFLTGRPDVDPQRIGGLGLSVGGEMLIQTAAESRALRAVVSEGAGVRSVREASELSWGEKWFEVPLFAVMTTATATFSNDAPPPNLKELVGRMAPRPIFLIYAGHGQGGEELNPAYYAAAGKPKTLWKIQEAGHTGGLSARPEEYERRVVGFFDRALLEGAS